MSTQFNLESRPQVFVDEVDRLIEFSDACVEYLPATPVGAPTEDRKPLLMEIVDRVLEFADAASEPMELETARSRQAIFVDTVDHLLDFTDEPVESPVPSQMGAAIPCAPGSALGPKGPEPSRTSSV
jgi:hypothetical protein